MIKQEVINKTREYINNISSISKRRRYNIALNKITEIQKENKLEEINNTLEKLNNEILECISNNEDVFEYIDDFIKQIPIFYKYFDKYKIKFPEDMKVVNCILAYYMYASGEDIKVNKNIIGEKIYLVSINNRVEWVYADRQKAEYKARTIMREHISLVPKIEEYEVIE